MPLHPQPKKLRDRLVSMGTFSFEGLSMADYRKSIDDLLPLAGKPQPVKEIIVKTIMGSNGAIPVKIYVPNNITSKGAIVYFVGHGYVYGNLKQEDVISRSLANACGCKIISVISRSAPENKYPAGLDDAYAGMKWAFENAEQFDINRTKIGICGDSSGGNFAAVSAIRARNEGIKLAFQILISPPVDLTMNMPSYEKYGHNYLLDAESAEWCFKQYLPANGNRKNPEISPLFEPNLAGLPSILIINAECEVLVDEGGAYAKRLKEAGVEVKRSVYEGQMHNFIFFRGEFDQEKNPIDEVGEYVREKFIGRIE